MLKKIGITIAATGAGFAWGGFVAARRIWHRWGIAPAEVAATLPGDELVADAVAVDTRGIDIAAPADKVWPWLVQMGYGRAGWYSYDGLDMDRPSVDRIVPELQTLEVGDILPTHPGGGFEVKVREPGHALVAYSDRALVESQAATAKDGLETASANVRATGAYLDKAMSGDFAASWAFVLEPKADGGTRLIERFRVSMEPPKATSGRPFMVPKFAFSMLGFGVFVMLRRQMLGIRDRAEGRPLGMTRPRLAARIRAQVAASQKVAIDIPGAA